MSVTLGQYKGDATTGFTSFDLTGYSIIYVSSSLATGAGAGTFGNPYAALVDGMSAVNAIASGNKVALVLRRGDSWHSEALGQIKRKGISGSFDGTWWADSTTWSGSPIIIGAYDESFPPSTHGINPKESTRARPLVAYQNSVGGGEPLMANGGGGDTGGGDLIALVGIEFYAADRDPNNSTIAPVYNAGLVDSGNTGVSLTPAAASTWQLVEDCKFSFAFGLNLGFTTGSNTTVRRNIITNAYRTGFHSVSGMVFDLPLGGSSNIVVEENLFDTNGWNPDVPAPTDTGALGFNHNFYLNDGNSPDVYVRGNIIARDASTPLTRCMMQCYENLFMANRSDFQVENLSGPSYVGKYHDNVVTECGSTALGVNIILPTCSIVSNYQQALTNYGTAEVYRNIFCHSQISGLNTCYRADCSSQNVNVHDNIIYHMQLGGGAKILSVATNDDGSTVDDWTKNSLAAGKGSILAWTPISGGAGGADGTYSVTSLTMPSGTGQGGEAKFTVTGGVATLNNFDGVRWNLFNTQANLGGYNWAVGDTFSAGPGGVVGYSAQVTDVSGNTDGGGNSSSDIYPSLGSYPDPMRTITSYCTINGIPSASLAGFVAVVSANQSRQTWSTVLTAAQGAVPYFQAGFGLIDEGGDVVLMGQACL